MPAKIRLMRIGAKKRPFYRVVVVDERKKRTGSYVELLGTYNPLTEPKEIKLKKDRVDWWIERGAVLSDGYLRITKQAPQKPPRKPKKEKELKPEPAAVPKTEEAATIKDVPADTTETQAAETTPETVPAEETAA